MIYKVLGHDQTVYGPVSEVQIRQWQAEGRVNSATLLLAEGSTEWRPLSSLPEFGPPPVVQMPPPPAVKQDNDMAVAGLIFGVLSNICCCFGVLCGILGVTFSIIALTRNEANPQRGGKGLAVAGLILSVVGLSWHLVLPLFFLGLPPRIDFPLHRLWRFP
jgi:hypothetical protein